MVVVALTVSAAVPTLSVQCTDLQTAARQAEQGAGRSCHVSCSGIVLSVFLHSCVIVLSSRYVMHLSRFIPTGWSLLPAAPVQLPTGVV